MRRRAPQAGPDDCLAPIPIPEDRVAGLRYARLLDDQLRGLRAARDHPNRTLFYDHVVIAHLLAFFNPAVVSLRKIEDAFENRSVRKHFGTPRVPKSTLADAQRLFDPDPVLPVSDEVVDETGARSRACPVNALRRLRFREQSRIEPHYRRRHFQAQRRDHAYRYRGGYR